jgi:predicted DNA-binding transcriptional regulator AlpA
METEIAMEYEFSLKFKLTGPAVTEDDIMERLGAADCTDALVGLGLPGYIGLDFIRESPSADDAVLSALADVRQALPMVELVEAGPDFVGLTDVADLIGMSRQNMRKLFVNNTTAFPAPVHGGSSMIWHLAQVLPFLRQREYAVTQSVLDVALAAMRVNIHKENALLSQSAEQKTSHQPA